MQASEPVGSSVAEPPTVATAAGGDGREVYDMIGIGFGPANAALAICLEEEAEKPGGRDLKRLFLEIRSQPVWHPGMLLEDSLLQISVLKDLATIRNPCSRFTFLNYVKERGRLFEFLNLRDLFPSRIEFNDYLNWVADQLRHRVRFGQEVTAILPVTGSPAAAGEAVELLRVVVRDVATGAVSELLTRDLVIATGGVPNPPPGIQLQAGGRAFHPHEFMQRIKRDYPDRDGGYRFTVVGSGQSAAELFCYLLNRYGSADVTAAIRRYAYKPVDDSDFTNEIFFPQMVDFLYALPDDKRKLILDQCRDVNYAVVDMPLIRRIYKCLYQERVEGRDRARIRPFLQLVEIEERPGAVVGVFQDLLRDTQVTIESDALIVATGYAWKKEHPLLGALAPWFQCDPPGTYRIRRDYQIASRDGFAPRVYLQGFAEETHGASETVLSLLPVRADDIVRSMLAAAPATAAEFTAESYTV